MCARCLEAPAPFVPEHFCVRCRTAFLSEDPLDVDGCCGLCRAGETEFHAAYSFGHYENELRRLIQLMKYDGVRTLAPRLGRWLAEALPRSERFDAIVPVPLHWLRFLQRGFNQSVLLGRELSRRTGIPLRTGVLRRVKATPKQTLLDDKGRRMNVRRAFRAVNPAAVRDRRILLLDDVLTTGATLNACARVLKEAGAAHVSTLTLARVDRRPLARHDSAAAAPKGIPHAGATA